MNKNKSYKINYLSEQFYIDFNSSEYPEIESKTDRPYMVMLIQIEENTFAIPFRTRITHKYSYRFANSSRKTNRSTGLDFTKAVIVNDVKYIGASARVNDAEYSELDINHYVIIRRFKRYVSEYIKYKKGLLPTQVSANYKYSTLKYFHKELGIY